MDAASVGNSELFAEIRKHVTGGVCREDTRLEAMPCEAPFFANVERTMRLFLLVMFSSAVGGTAHADARFGGFDFPMSLHAGGAFVGGVGKAETSVTNFGGEAFLEGHIFDVFAVGVLLRSQRVESTTVVQQRANSIRARLRARVPLNRARSRRYVPIASLGLDFGGGWLERGSDDRRILAVGCDVRFEVSLQGRVFPYVELGYDRTKISVGSLRQLDIAAGLSVRIGGRTAWGSPH